MWQGSEKRKFPRADFSCKITIYFPEEHALIAHTKNIGRGGLRVVLKENINVSSVVGMEIFLSNEETVKCKGKVVWKVKDRSSRNEPDILYDLGIEFMDIKDSDREKIGEVVDRLLRS